MRGNWNAALVAAWVAVVGCSSGDGDGAAADGAGGTSGAHDAGAGGAAAASGGRAGGGASDVADAAQDAPTEAAAGGASSGGAASEGGPTESGAPEAAPPDSGEEETGAGGAEGSGGSGAGGTVWPDPPATGGKGPEPCPGGNKRCPSNSGGEYADQCVDRGIFFGCGDPDSCEKCPGWPDAICRYDFDLQRQACTVP